ncbi:uncharacterized protein TDEL_0B03320 [Torulaspora delbrueckii]|uniref:BTB domain-containing protein n=1 Tax=Torulaspora delbrueckii TaxID=4950 RepID=G8ZPB7_TORDE|nr:hypothetical protein TDEL_0B03320 [Torulaspora delbrueckii]CCE90461.1 hypothetical protein TDEL_0B03320 [Torulaspora delbrueckii]
MPRIAANKKSKHVLEKRDVFGRNIGYLRSCLPELTHFDSVNLYSHDLESGYSPLHVTLQRGYLRKSFLLYKRWKDEIEFLSHKFGGHVFNQLDREGLTPLELYSMRFSKRDRRFPHYIRYQSDLTPSATWSKDPADISEDLRFAFMELPMDEAAQNCIKQRGGSHLLTWGSNVNYQLGTGNKDDRQNMFQLAIDQLNKTDTLELTASRFKKILITRYHSIIVTTENKVYTCGNSSRGRLGNGVADVPQPKFAEILDLKDTEIMMFKTSNHHTLLLTDKSDVYSWGWNGYGQLGYSTNSKNTDLDKVFGSVPKKISFLEGEEVVNISCSKIHSCAVSANGKLFMWGLNVGQLGGFKPVHKTPDSIYQNQDAYVTNTPVITNIANSPVEQVVCTDFATFVRLQGNILQVYTNYTVRSFKIPMAKAKSNKDVDAFAHFTPREIPSKVVDMQCTNTFGNNLTFKYDCGRIGIVTVKEESQNMWTKLPNILPVTLYWSPKFENRKCMDFAISSKGSLIICTAGGEVFTTSGSNNSFEKVHSSRLITGRAISVACEPSFVSFAILKDETSKVPTLYPKDRLLYDFSRYSPKYGARQDIHTRITYGFPEFSMSDYMTDNDFLYTSFDDTDTRKKKRRGFYLADFEKKRTVAVNQDGEKASMDFNIKKDFDFKFRDDKTNEDICQFHKLLLRSIAPWIVKSMIPWYDRSLSFEKFLEFSWGDCDYFQGYWAWAVKSAEFDSGVLAATLKEVVHYFYTDEKPVSARASKLLLKLLDSSYHTSSLPHTLRELLQDHNVRRLPPRSLNSFINPELSPEELASKNNVEETYAKLSEPDVELKLTDGILYGHSLVLRVRSSFFEILLLQLSSHHGSSIDLRNFEHASVENVSCVLRYMYGLPYNEIYSLIRKDHFTEKIQFYLDMLQLCDQLNLDYLKNYTESLTMDFINGETVVPILINASYSNSRLLAQQCCWFICLHIGLLFSKENLELIDDHFDSHIWQQLEDTLKEMCFEVNQQEDNSWYTIPDVNWLELFQTNLHAYNERFMDSKRSFAPVIELKTSTSENKSANRRRSSNQTATKSRKPSFVNNMKVPFVVEEKISWRGAVSAGDTTAIDDNEEFTEVVKKSKRRTSSHSQLQTNRTQSPPSAQTSGKVVIHASKEKDSESLPSLLSQAETSLNEQSEGETAATKIKRSFKKGSQKQRVGQLSAEDLNTQDDTKKTTWGNRPAKASRNSFSSGNSVNHRKQSLPSLYDSNPAPAAGKKREKIPVLSVGPSASSEVRTHGTWGMAAPYIPMSEDISDAMTSQKKPTLEERVAAKEFERWFEHESAKVQKQLNKDNKTVKDGFKAVYKASEGMPEFLTDETSSNKKNGKKPRFKFQSKHKTKNDGADTVLW